MKRSRRHAGPKKASICASSEHANMTRDIKPWEQHYGRDRSRLGYPDEALVRMLRPWIAERNCTALRALDLGCGSGRHLSLLAESGVMEPVGLDLSAAALARCRACAEAGPRRERRGRPRR